MTLRIDYDAEDFPLAGPVKNGAGTLLTNWDEVLHAAVTVGRPNRQYVFKHGDASLYEALFRWSLVRMALEQSGPKATRLRRTAAARTLDPSEKGAINYFLGLAIAKLFAEKLLDAPWLLHLDVFRPMLNAVLAGRSRPDLVGQRKGGDWVALECKGRVSPPSDLAKDKAKYQAQRLISVNGTVPTFQVGAIAYFKDDTLRFFWRDPEPDPTIRNPIEIRVEPETWRHYYAPALDLIRSRPAAFDRMREEPFLVPVENADVKIGIAPDVLRPLAEARWEEARRNARPTEIGTTQFRYQPDGIAVVAGESWLRPFNEGSEEQPG